MKPKNKISINWTPSLAYAVGLLVSDGNLSKDGRHMELCSKDKIQIINFIKALGISNKIGIKFSGVGSKCYRVQFGDVNFYNFLLSIGLSVNKSKTISKINIPRSFFFDFLRGHFDGDGTFYSYWDPRWRSSFMFYTEFISASQNHILWIQKSINKLLGIKGHITKSDKQACYQLKYAKAESYKLFPKIYYPGVELFLNRKYLKIKKALAIIGRSF
jgi:hypothetical protein